MKFTAIATLLATAAASVRASSSDVAHRFLEDVGGDGANGGYVDIGTGFLMDYDLVFLKCQAGLEVTNADGTTDANAALFRFCPTGEACASKRATSCSSGYGDYVVGLSTFAKTFLETFNRNQDQNDGQQQFNLAEFGQCGQFKADRYAADGYYPGGQAVDQDAVYYVGPACAKDGKSIRLGLFSDMYCTTSVTDITFEQITGMELPYENGGMVPTDECRHYYCYGENQNNGQMELFELCTANYQNAALKCETQMEGMATYAADNGYDNFTPQTTGCATVKSYYKTSSSDGMSGAGKFFLVVLVLGVVGGIGAALFLQQRRKKGSAAAPLI